MFVASPDQNGRLFRDPILASRSRLSAARASGLGATTSASSGVSTGAQIGSAVGTALLPGIGTAIGNIAGSIWGGIFGGGGHVADPNALAKAQKWYAWYFPDWAAMNAGTGVTLQSGYDWWVRQINADGAPKAWQNFSQSAQPVQDNVAQRAALYQQLGYGAPTDAPPPGTNPLVAPPQNLTYQQFTGASAPASVGSVLQPSPVQILTSAGATPQQIAAMTPAQQAVAAAQIAPQQASLLGGLSSTTLLLLGGGLLVGLVLMNRPRSGPVA